MDNGIGIAKGTGVTFKIKYKREVYYKTLLMGASNLCLEDAFQKCPFFSTASQLAL